MVTQTMSSAVFCALPFCRVALCHVFVAEVRGSNVSKTNFKHAPTIPPPSVVILAQPLWSPFASTPPLPHHLNHKLPRHGYLLSRLQYVFHRAYRVECAREGQEAFEERKGEFERGSARCMEVLRRRLHKHRRSTRCRGDDCSGEEGEVLRGLWCQQPVRPPLSGRSRPRG